MVAASLMGGADEREVLLEVSGQQICDCGFPLTALRHDGGLFPFPISQQHVFIATE